MLEEKDASGNETQAVDISRFDLVNSLMCLCSILPIKGVKWGRWLLRGNWHEQNVQGKYRVRVGSHGGVTIERLRIPGLSTLNADRGGMAAARIGMVRFRTISGWCCQMGQNWSSRRLIR